MSGRRGGQLPFMPRTDAPVQYRVVGMDCAHDAAEIEQATRAIDGVRAAKVSVASQLLTLELASGADAGGAIALPAVERAVAALGYRLLPVDGTAPVGAWTPTAAYRRALWIVALLNLGYGVVEVAGGLLADSQALLADALDFVGDGLITLLGLLAIAWSLRWRARAALLQGLFLAAMGVGVLASTAWRVLVRHQPEADVMGMLGAAALAVNVAAALVLRPHRAGDAGARAIWLFSRNDAIGNAAVIAAALLVAWTGTPWPDLVVAVAIAALFLHSAWIIVRDARADLGAARD